MCNEEQLLEFVYGELTPAGRSAFEAHLALCTSCRAEVEQLRTTRHQLAAWAPPEPALDFRVVRGAQAPRQRAWVPAWGLAAAASVLILAGAAAVANVELRFGSDGFVVRTGWAAHVPEAASSQVPRPSGYELQAAADAAASDQLKRQIALLESRLKELEQAAVQGPGSGVQTASSPSTLSQEQLAVVRRMLAESESRQRTERAAQIAQVWSDFRAARAGDFVRFHEALGRAQGLTNYQLKQHRDSIDSLVRVSLQK